MSASAAHIRVSCRELVGKAPLIWRRENLAAARLALGGGETSLRPGYRALTARAEAALLQSPRSVVRKTGMPPSGDKHDYHSLAPYWWPDSTTHDGQPYIRKDGEVNPERSSDAFDRVRSYAMVDDVRTLALAAFFSGQEKYAKHASDMLRVWFVDPATRMNPNMQYAQAIPGRESGRSFGIIDTANYVDVVDATLLLVSQELIDTGIASGVRDWFTEYARWLATDPMGLKERAARNNHGTFYDAQLISYSLFAGDCALARRVIDDSRARIGSQITASGEMPFEQERTRSLHYFTFNLDAFLTIARMSEHLGVDLYSYTASDGGSILSSVALLASYAGKEDQWPHQQMGNPDLTASWRVLRKALTAIDEPALEQAVEKAAGKEVTDIANLLYFPTAASSDSE